MDKNQGIRFAYVSLLAVVAAVGIVVTESSSWRLYFVGLLVITVILLLIYLFTGRKNGGREILQVVINGLPWQPSAKEIEAVRIPCWNSRRPTGGRCRRFRLPGHFRCSRASATTAQQLAIRSPTSWESKREESTAPAYNSSARE